MKKILALALALALALSMGGAALALTPQEAADAIIPGRPADWPTSAADPDDPYAILPIQGAAPVEWGPVPRSFVGDIVVDGDMVIDLRNVPGAPEGYLPMRAVCEAMDAYVSWEAETNTAVFLVDGHDIEVDLSTLSVQLDFEPAEGVTAYLDPGGYTFLPAPFLDSLPHITVDSQPYPDGVRYDIATQVYTPEEALANAILEAAQASAMFQLDQATLAENYGFHLDAYDAIAAFQPMMTAQPTTVIVAHVKEGQMEIAKADFAAYLEAVKSTLGFYPATAEALEQAQVVQSGDDAYLMLVSTWESNDMAVSMFHEAFPG